MILYINSCVRKDSRTDRIARHLLNKLGGDYTEINLENEAISPLNEEMLAQRTELISSGDFSDPMFRYAKQFSEADKIVISAPYWDLSFPASLKVYIENIMATGITFRYNEKGIPIGLCKANQLYYVTTAGGPFAPDFGYNYIRDLSTKMLGIKETELIKAEMLDVFTDKAETVVNEIIESL